MPTSASAQTSEPARPYRGLFGRAVVNPEARHTTLFTAAVYGAHDESPAESGSGTAQGAGFYTGAQARLTYRRTTRIGIHAEAVTSARYYPEAKARSGASHQGLVGMTAPIGRRGRMHVTQTASRSSYHLLTIGGPAAGDTTIPGAVPDLVVSRRSTSAFITSTGVTHPIGRRATLDLSYGFQHTGLHEDAAGNAHVFSARWGRPLARHLSMRVGYGYYTGQYALSSPTRTAGAQDIDLGVDYTRAFRLSRRTTLGVTAASSVWKAADRTEQRIVGGAVVTRTIGRTWTARADYQRRLQVLETFGEPFFGDAIAAHVSGYVGRRIDVSASTRFATGDIGFAGATHYDTLVGSGGARYALTRRAAVYAEYIYYRYAFGHGALLPPGLLPSSQRHSARIGLVLWAPLGGNTR